MKDCQWMICKWRFSGFLSQDELKPLVKFLDTESVTRTCNALFLSEFYLMFPQPFLHHIGRNY